ncbi:MAG: hypothetical protein WBW84_05100 [Acidobacteriaceae bacterium]
MVIDGVPTRSVSGIFYLEYREDGRRVQRPVGNSPRQAKDAWIRLSNPDTAPEEEPEPDEQDPESLTVQEAFDRFLREVKASKELETWCAYRGDLNWVRPKLSRKLVTQITRADILELMGKGRDEGLNPKSVTRRMIVAVTERRSLQTRVISWVHYREHFATSVGHYRRISGNLGRDRNAIQQVLTTTSCAIHSRLP